LRNPRDFFKPLAIDAPEPLREIPFGPSRMIHFLDFSNEKMVAKAADIAKQTDILLGNLEDAIPVDRKEAAREGLIQAAKESTSARRALDPGQRAREPWVLDDLTSWSPRSATVLEVIMVPKVEGRGTSTTSTAARPARGKGGARAAAPGARDPRDLARGREPRGDRDGQPAHAGHELRPGRPGRLARMKTTRVGGGHPATR
jgi:malyl-CoA/(S)-citramalyl-CoA lyase